MGCSILLLVLKNTKDSEWGALSFPHTKPKINQAYFLSDFRNPNKQLKYKPYPMPKINEILSKLDGF